MPIPHPRRGAAALITGASSGIGAELARQLSARGHNTILVARRRDRLETLAAELRSSGAADVAVITADVSAPDERRRLLAEIAALGVEVDVLIPCAGFGLGGPFVEADGDRLREMLRVNFEAPLALAHALAPAMVARRSGAILLVSSVAGEAPLPNFAAYAATKAAVTSLAEALSWELGRHDVTVSALCPGGVRTEFAGVAGMTATERRTPGALLIDADACAAAALDGLDRGARIVTPLAPVRASAWVGRHLPRRLWLAVAGRMLAGPPAARSGYSS